ncbi:NB-ARC domain-containing protein [Streptomyces cellulosae]|uniref:NB-ARC domain-containing protein n=1 Tax=Streptomyces cellulosae TaxID=1968 RepID=A0ABW7YHB2_STRCE
MRTVFLAVLAGICGLLGALLGLAANAATGDEKWPGLLDQVRAHAWPVTGVLGGAMVVLGVLAVVIERRPEPAVRNDPRPPSPPRVPDHFVAREQSREVVAAVCARAGQVGITTSLRGSGGFGKTLLAKHVCGQRQVQRHFRQRVYFVTVGRDVRSRAEIAAKVGEAVTLITGDTSTPATDPDAAGAHLGRLLDERPRTLLVLDDVWEERQLAPFLIGGPRCARLITTRNTGLLPPGAPQVHVDQMTPEQAEQVLTRDLPLLPRPLVAGLLQATGRWALLLRLANRLIARHVSAGTDAQEAAEELLQQLRVQGPVAVDGPAETWDLDDRDLRNQAVEASVRASTTLLQPEAAERFTELGIFAEDEPVPLTLAAALWQATGGLTQAQARLLCQDLAHLSLITYTPAEGRLQLHDVIRDYLRAHITPDDLARLHGTFVDAIVHNLPPATPLAAGTPAPGRAWWQAPEGYLHDHLISHILAAHRPAQAEAVAGDIRWAEMRLHQRGANAPWNDLMRIGTPHSLALARSLAQNAHLLTLTEPAHAPTHLLHARLEHHPHWRPQIHARRRTDPSLLPCLAPRWPLPDTHPAAHRTLTGHSGGAWSLAWSADGRLAIGGIHGPVRVWDVNAGTATELTGHTGGVRSLAWSTDGRLATGGIDWPVRVWDVNAGTATELTGHTGTVRSVAWSTDGRLATGSVDGTVRVWDVSAGTATELTGHTLGLLSVAWSTDGRLATGSVDGTVLVWDMDAATATELTGHTEIVRSVAWCTDGRLATGSNDGTVLVWDVSASTATELPGHAGGLLSVASSTDGRLAASGDDGVVRVWDMNAANATDLPGRTPGLLSVAWSTDGRLATSGDDGVVRMWDVNAGTATELPGHARGLRSVAWSADGRLAAGGIDGVVRVWDVNAGTATDLTGHTGWVQSVAWSTDGRLATGSIDGLVRMWDMDAGTATELPGHTQGLLSVAWSTDGRLATGSGDGLVRVWDVNAGTATDLTGHTQGVRSVAWSADGRLATGGDDGVTRVWDVNAGTATELPGHTQGVRSVAWSADGRLATGSGDGVTRVWDVAGRRVLALFRVDGSASSCCWSHDGKILAVGSSSGLFLLDFLTA